jgi:hypothetical protein
MGHPRGKAPSPLQFQKILYYQIQVKKEEFWECIRTGVPVDRPVELDEPTAVEHPSWVVAVLVGQLHVSADELAAMSLEEAEARVHEHWSST